MEPNYDKLIGEFGIDDNEEVRDALLEAFMSGVVMGMGSTDVQQAALDFFSDEVDTD